MTVVKCSKRACARNKDGVCQEEEVLMCADHSQAWLIICVNWVNPYRDGGSHPYGETRLNFPGYNGPKDGYQ